MNQLQIFKNETFGEVRTIEEQGKIVSCGSDIAKALGYTNPQKAVKDHCREDGVTFCSVTDNIGRTQQAKLDVYKRQFLYCDFWGDNRLCLCHFGDWYRYNIRHI